MYELIEAGTMDHDKIAPDDSEDGSADVGKPSTGGLVAMTSSPSSSAMTFNAEEALEDFQRLHPTQALEPGYYWTATKSVSEQIPEGETLLLLDVIEFEGRTHSVELRQHPRHGKGRHTLLIDGFLDAFLPCADGEAVRQREQQAVMQEVADLQAELMAVQADPRLMIEAVREDVERGIAEMERKEKQQAHRESVEASDKQRDLRKLHRRAARRSEAKGNPLVAPRIAMASDVGGLIDGGINEAGVAELRKMASQQAVVATAQANWLTTKTTAIAKTLEKLGPYIEERSAVALARSSGAVKMAERIKRGIESLDLYTGKGVEVFDVRVGKDAPDAEPLTLVQGKRYAEEELAVWADVDSSFDFSNKEQFFEALATNDALLDQVLPAPRCVATVAMTRNERDYGNAIANLLNNQQNLLVFLLVRNGQNVHAVYSSSPSHEGAPRLFPTHDELEESFRGWDGSKVSIRDIEFGESAKRFDDIAICYRRFLILLCGLDHRLGLLGRFYPPEWQMKFMSREFQERFFRFVPDEDSGWLIGEELPPLGKWMETRNAMLQSGSRVFVLRGSEGLHKNSPELKRRLSLEPTGAQFSRPFVAFKDAGRLVVEIEATDRYSERGREHFKCELSAEGNSAFDGAWWLCVDDVALDEVRRYIGSRIYRGMGVAYLRLFKRLEAYLALEAEEEAASRAYILQAAVEHGGLTPALAAAALNTAVRNWRAARRGAPLPGIEDKADLNEVLSLMVPEGHLSIELRSMLERFLEQSGVNPLLLTRSGKDRLMLYVEASAEDRAPYPDILTWGWVKRITLDIGKTKLKSASSTMVWLTKTLPASEVEVQRWEGLEAWQNKDAEPISPRDYAAVRKTVEASKEWEASLAGGFGGGIEPGLFDRVLDRTTAIVDQARRKARSAGRYSFQIPGCYLAIPLAAYSSDGRTINIAYAFARAEAVLHAYGSAVQAEQVRQTMRARYARASTYDVQEKLKEWKWHLTHSAEALKTTHDAPFAGNFDGAKGRPSWASAQVEVNRKLSSSSRRPGHRYGAAKGKPCTTTVNVDLSLDRALDQLTGRVPGFLRAAFYEHTKDEAKRSSSWDWDDRHRNETEEVRAARLKAKKRAILAKRYVHAYKALVSPLVWSADKGRPMANKLFSAPFAGAGAARAEDNKNKKVVVAWS